MDMTSGSTKSRGQTVKSASYVVTDFKLASGEAMPLVVRRQTRVPDAYVLRYLIVTHRTPGSSSNTMRNVCQGIAVGLSYLEEQAIDLMERLTSGLFLSRDELATFSNRCLTRVNGRGAVVTQYAKRRFLDFAEYLLWRFEAIAHRAAQSDLKFLNDQRSGFRKRVKSQCPKGSAGALQRDRLGLTDEQRNLLLEVIKPDSPRNPFLAKFRRRNQAVILLHYRYGLRAGELAGLHRSDYRNHEQPAQLFVHIRHHDPVDRRNIPPRAKTRARMLEISGDAKAALDSWLGHRADRSEFPLARKSHFVFVNDEGAEISLRAAFGIFEHLRDVYPELGSLGSHVLRHDMNERYVADGEEFGWDPEQMLEDQRYINGWAEDSQMPQLYSKATIRNRANRRIFELQQKLVS